MVPGIGFLASLAWWSRRVLVLMVGIDVSVSFLREASKNDYRS